jgi:hypothetical protein
VLDLLGDLPEVQVADEMAVILAGVGQRHLDYPAGADPGCMKQRTRSSSRALVTAEDILLGHTG